MSAAEPLPFEERCRPDPRETHDREGARRLAKEIEEYWASRGGVVNTRIVSKGFSIITRCERYEIHSDLVDGRPNPNAKKLTNGPVEVKHDREDHYS